MHQLTDSGDRPGFHVVRDAATIRAMHKRLADRAALIGEDGAPLQRLA